MRAAAASRTAAAPASGERNTAAGGPQSGSRRPNGFIGGPAGALIARPWFDHVALWGVARCLFPLGRAWAAATVAEGSLERFAEALPAPRIVRGAERRVRAVLSTIATQQAALTAAEQSWDDLFFAAAAADSTALAVA